MLAKGRPQTSCIGGIPPDGKADVWRNRIQIQCNRWGHDHSRAPVVAPLLNMTVWPGVAWKPYPCTSACAASSQNIDPRTELSCTIDRPSRFSLLIQRALLAPASCAHVHGGQAHCRTSWYMQPVATWWTSSRDWKGCVVRVCHMLVPGQPHPL